MNRPSGGHGHRAARNPDCYPDGSPGSNQSGFIGEEPVGQIGGLRLLLCGIRVAEQPVRLHSALQSGFPSRLRPELSTRERTEDSPRQSPGLHDRRYTLQRSERRGEPSPQRGSQSGPIWPNPPNQGQIGMEHRVPQMRRTPIISGSRPTQRQAGRALVRPAPNCSLLPANSSSPRHHDLAVRSRRTVVQRAEVDAGRDSVTLIVLAVPLNPYLARLSRVVEQRPHYVALDVSDLQARRN